MAATSKQTMKYAFGPYFSIVLQFSAFYDPLQTTGEPSVAREQRKLVAILAAIVGYSRLMGRDESGTLARLREHRKERLKPALARYGGLRRGRRCRAA